MPDLDLIKQGEQGVRDRRGRIPVRSSSELTEHPLTVMKDQSPVG
jgi:hypothetical protein